ncbi:Kelch repeat-containing protein [Melittangium boletus]|uniref:Branched-chain amino acid ABC transporter substrate-binding protein n=1 Tax=Melittangium boletus DSM 14713 TaxID=1294270 RepID=A0A250IS58_9BACT|nr:kelch repeat-containing protein [Melittangium boletus]ATB34072.1 hypothetical protein MEBOL_007573 [Melittangium boletus DSM 14713]
MSVFDFSGLRESVAWPIRMATLMVVIVLGACNREEMPGGQVCTPGAGRSCAYTGPAGTEGVGTCRAAKQTCNAAGAAWSECTGEVLPQPELYANAVDEDCDGVASLCAPGSHEACAYTGPAGTEGVGVCHAGARTCDISGTSWSACTGEVLPQPEVYTNAVDEDCDGVASLCAPGSHEACAYTGPAGTEGVGVCQAGSHTCDISGTSWSACTGEVLPQPEVYTNAVDEDCDGVASLCAPGTTESCYSGPAGTEGVGMCHAGARTCNASGTAWGACTGAVVPQTEVCGNTLDEDCDGQIDDSPPCAGWFSAGSMTQVRLTPSATLLADGKVLVAAGYTPYSGTRLATAELYDPTTGTWSATGSMSAPRWAYTATLLANGSVLVSGGVDANGYLGTAMLYNPTTGTWSATGSMSTLRAYHTATLLADGKVLVVGGFDGVGTHEELKTAELYDPTSGTWSVTGSMSTGRDRHMAVLLTDGKVLVSGGGNRYVGSLATAELYDPTSGTWSVTGSMVTARQYHAATVLADGQVLVAGGAGNGYLATAELYDPTRRTWSATGSMTTARYAHSLTMLADGQVLISGGNVGGSSGDTSKAELYDPTRRTWSATKSMRMSRYFPTATLLLDGRVLVTGGTSAEAELYDPSP